jgi:hypothetical protein
MKKFNQAKIVLFDSTIASFKLSVEASFTRQRQDGSFSNLVYVTEKGTANLNPSIYLVFSFKGDTYESSKNLYTSFPQLFKLRAVLEEIKDLLIGNKGFFEVENVLNVRPENKQPIVVADIGKQSKSISFTLVAIDSGEDGLGKKVPGVSIQISDSEYVSVLTADELLTIYTIINDIDLASISVQLSSLFLASEDSGYSQPVYQQVPQYQPAPQQYPAQQYQQPQYQPAPQPQQQRPQQRYNSNPMPKPSQQRTMQAPQQQAAPVQQQTGQSAGLPPRKNEKQIVNMKAVEETPVSTVSFNDEEAINSIFDDNN